MRAEDLNKIIWPTSVDMMGQVVVSVTFFFLLMFIVLAYFLQQIQYQRRVRVDEQTYQILYEQVARYIGPSEIKREAIRRPNIDELILQIQDYVLSVPPSRVERIRSLIAKRNELVGDLNNLGYTGYSAEDPFSGDYAVMPIVTADLLTQQGAWSAVPAEGVLIVRFEDNSIAPDRDSNALITEALRAFAQAADGRTIGLTVYDSTQMSLDTLNQRLSLRRSFAVRDALRAAGIRPEGIRIRNVAASERYPFGSVELRYD